MKNKTKKIIVGSAAVTVAATALCAAWRGSAKKFMKIALDREEPKNMEKGRERLTGSKEMSDIMERVMTAASALERQNLPTVEITSHDDVRLVAHWYCPENPKRVIVAMHGWRSSWAQDFGIISQFWFDNDCAVLYTEQRGQGESGGEYMGFGLLERYDCRDWVNWVNEHTQGKLPIYLCGISMGAATVLMTSGFELPQNVRGIIADCGFTSPHAIWKHVAQNNLRIPYGIYRAAADDMCEKRIQIRADDYSCTQALSNARVPVLFIHGTDDRFVPVEMTYENYKACVSPKKLFVVPGAEHGMSYIVDKDGYEQTITDFWQKYDETHN